MARKGVLVSDPTVRSMSKAQWLFEYNGLIKKECDETERAFTGMKATLISILGLNMKSSVKNKDLPADKRFQADLDEFTPLVLLAGNHHLLKQYFKDGDSIGEEDRTGESTVSDADFAAQSQAMLDDMEPIDVPIAQMTAADIERIAQHRDLGIANLDDPQLPIQPTTVIIRDSEA